MKKILFLAGAALTAGSIFALEPKVYPGMAFCGVAPDGSLAVSTLEYIVSVVDLVSGNEYSSTEDEMIYTGSGNFISNTGKVVGSKMETAAVWQNGSWNTIESATAYESSYANGITREGTRIVGSVAPQGSNINGLMLVPCYWDMNSDGTYGDVNLLPYPDKDFTGRVPQYVTALGVSEDGNTIIGQVQDYSGMVVQPIMYTQDDKGEWTYTLLQNSLYHPEGFVLPADPGDCPDVFPEDFMTEEELAAYNQAVDDYFTKQAQLVYPEPQQFMSDEEFAAYMAALDQYYETWENYPDERDYMTEEEYAAYEKAVADYYELQASLVYPEYADYMTEEEYAAYTEAKKAVDEWDEKWMEFAQAFGELCEIVPNYVFNNVQMMANGSKFATTYAKGDFFSGYEYTPYVFNLTDGTYTPCPADLNLIVSSITDDGSLLAQKPGDWEFPIAQAYIRPADSNVFEPIHSYLASKNESLGQWITENMTHEVTSYAYDEDTFDYVEVKENILITGIPFASADLSIVAFAVENSWYDWDSDEEYYPAYGYIVDTTAYSGIKDAQIGSVSVKPLPAASLSLSGDVASLVVYDITGRKAFEVSNPGEVVSTGLGTGVYVVKAVAADGSKTIVKVAF